MTVAVRGSLIRTTELSKKSHGRSYSARVLSAIRAFLFVATQSPATVIQNNWFIKLHFKNVGRAPAIVTDCQFKIGEFNSLPLRPDYTGASQLGVQRTISVGETVETTETGPAPTLANWRGAELVFFGRLIYSELNGRLHHTGFALRVAPMMPATVSYDNRNYDYYD